MKSGEWTTGILEKRFSNYFSPDIAEKIKVLTFAVLFGESGTEARQKRRKEKHQNKPKRDGKRLFLSGSAGGRRSGQAVLQAGRRSSLKCCTARKSQNKKDRAARKGRTLGYYTMESLILAQDER